MAVDVLYVAWNRLRYTQESFTALADNTDWGDVAALFVHDDGSDDGTDEWLLRAADDLDANLGGTVRVVYDSTRLGGPVAAMNYYLDNKTETIVCRSCGGSGRDGLAPKLNCKDCRGSGEEAVDRFAKIDNDFVVCPGWLPELNRQFTLNPGLDIVGMEPRYGPPVAAPADRELEPADFIGGKGLIRHRAFEQCRPRPRSRGRQPGYYGFTEWQRSHRDIQKAWIRPDLPVFGLDQLPIDPWPAIAAEYAAQGWQRPWEPYDPLEDGYWAWWEPVFEEATA